MPLIYYLPRVFDMKYASVCVCVRGWRHNSNNNNITMHITRTAYTHAAYTLRVLHWIAFWTFVGAYRRGYLYWFYATNCMCIQHTVNVLRSVKNEANYTHTYTHSARLMSNVDVFSTSFFILFLCFFLLFLLHVCQLNPVILSNISTKFFVLRAHLAQINTEIESVCMTVKWVKNEFTTKI